MTLTRFPDVGLRHAPFLAAAIAAAFPLSTLAQQTDAALPAVQVTATRTPQPVRDVLTDNVVITAEQIAASGQTNLVDLLQQQRGLEVSRYGGPGTAASVFLRGSSNAQNVVLIDGVRVGSSTLGGATWSALPLSQIDRIEIVYGPLSTMYGADAVGGVVQIFTRKGERAPSLTVGAGLGSYGTRNLEAGLSGATGGEHAVRYSVNVAREHAEGFSATRPESLFSNPDKDGYTRESASGQLGMDLAKGHEIGLTFLHSRLEGEYDVGPSTENDRSISQVGAYSIYSRNHLLPNWTSLLRLSSGLDKAKDISSFGTDTAKTRQDAFSWQNDITIGSDLAQVLLERRIEHVESSSFNADSRTTNSIAASYQMRRGAHLASASVRNDDSSQYGSKTTGNLGYGYRITDALRVNASAGTSFRAPTYNELYFPGYGLPTNRPEQGHNAEAGVYYEKGSDRFSAVYYRNRITDLIDYAPKCPGSPAGADVSCAYNINKALLTGLTLGASTRFGPYTLRGSLDFQNPRDETTGQLLVRRAKRHGTLALEYAVGALAGGIETRFTSRRSDFDDLGNPTTLGGYALLNLYASYQVSRDWSVYGRWNNMLDKDYALASGYATAGSNVFVGVRYTLR
ncbi:MAG: TonB-dependent receptor plug domain-containing protein [Burkholderiaceae bacterium]